MAENRAPYKNPFAASADLAETPESRTADADPGPGGTPSTSGLAAPPNTPTTTPLPPPAFPLPPVPVRYVRTVQVRPPRRPSLRRNGTPVYALIWPDQAEWLEGAGISVSMAVRLAIDAARGVDSPFEAQLTEEETRMREAARYAIFRAVQERDQFSRRRAAELADLKAKCDAHLAAASKAGSARPLVAWIEARRRKYRTLRNCQAEDLAEEMGYEL
jgi:hypothetical protein